MKPLRTFIFFVALGLLLSVIALLIPPRGVGITDDLQLNFFDIYALFRKGDADGGPAEVSEQTLKHLEAASRIDEDPEAEPVVDLFRPAAPLADTGGHPDVNAADTGSYPAINASGTGSPEEGTTVDTGSHQAVAAADTESLQRSVHPIRFATGRENYLDPFFRELEGLRNGEVKRTRILHYGDSQIENDRMTALIRYRLQTHFGGSGTGLVPAVPLYSGHLAYRQTSQGDWLRYTFFGKRDSTIRHNSYGVMGAFASVPLPGEEWPSLSFRFNLNRRTGRADRVRIYLHSYVDSAAIAFRVDGIATDTLSPFPAGFSVADYRHSSNMKELTVSFNLSEGGRIYGISFESTTGLQVDNIAMRGSAGLLFSRLDRDQQTAMMDHLDPGLILLQFGGNVVPYVDPAFYKKVFIRELRFFRKMCPGVPIVVIGPSDMSIKERGIFVTNPNLEPVCDALKAAARESGVAFWDLYEAMGGYNSMPSFVHADPPLASPDYVHFTNRGINLVAEMFYNALIVEYNNYTGRRNSAAQASADRSRITQPPLP